ncbi:hypothetical protein LTR70_005071 [Exophiala xenobiotica]|uniref:Uncharacterized protein n=1 Tax=Lithohypha guttulata TaxID=1690604 RepID=A0ABR0K8W4_9EURO|nr:hypothetical protein LTR24_005547 [Lithohypha guttulata]KAK5319318.1 hypothetical protein LTR70_005071 [Exophiala xenobiotica]
MLVNKALHAISAEIYLQEATFRFSQVGQARFYSRLGVPTEHSKRIRYLTGLLKPLTGLDITARSLKKTFPELRLIILKARLCEDNYRRKLLNIRWLRDSVQAQNISFTTYLNFVCPRPCARRNSPWQTIKVTLTNGGMTRLFETKRVEQDFYNRIKQYLEVEFGGDACTGWPDWQSGKDRRYCEVEWQK